MPFCIGALRMRTDPCGRTRSQSNARDMEQKDHVLRVARGVQTKGEDFDRFLELLCVYVDADDDRALDEQPLYRYWAHGGAPETPPPLGIQPRIYWLEERLAELDAAIKRYRESGKLPPIDWTNERFAIAKELEA